MKYLIVKTDYNEDNLTSGLYEVHEDLTFEQVQEYLKENIAYVEDIAIYEQGDAFDKVSLIGEKFLNMDFSNCKSGYEITDKYVKSLKGEIQ